MNKHTKRTVVVLAVVVVLAAVTAGLLFADNKPPRDVPVQASYISYTFAELQAAASVIAVVEPADALSEANSVAVRDDNGVLTDFYALRRVRLSRVIANESGQALSAGDELTVMERAAVTTDNDYLHPTDYDAMQKGKRYLLYLMPSSLEGTLCIMSGGNGRVRLDDFAANERQDIALLSAAAHLSGLDRAETERITHAPLFKGVLDTASAPRYKLIKTEVGDITLAYTELADFIYIELSHGDGLFVNLSADKAAQGVLAKLPDKP